jgi:hypothetical protein
MSSRVDYRVQDRRTAASFAAAACTLDHVIYLGGLYPGKKASDHLRSRAEVGEILRSSLPTTEFRAGPIIGSGSASFEMIRYLTERIPIMIAPAWLEHPIQPIAIRDILQYLVLALEREPMGVVEVGSEQLTYRDMISLYATVRELPRRWICTVPPLIPPRVAAYWLSLVTPLPSSLAASLMEGIAYPLLADTRRAEEVYSEVRPISYRRAVELALERIQQRAVQTRWSGASGQHSSVRHVDREGAMREVRSVHVELRPAVVFKSFASIGGDRGWLAWEWVWELRGLIDKMLGGPGLRRGRRHPTEILPGEALDFWRVEEVRVPELLRLRAEMKVPGHAWLQWEVKTQGTGARLVQTAVFVPHGFWGAFYWYCLYPIHHLIFRSLLKAITREAADFGECDRDLELQEP